MFQVLFRIKVLTSAAVDAFLDGRSQIFNFLFSFFQKTKPCPNHLTGIVISATEDAITNEILIMRAYGGGYCSAHDGMFYAANVRIFLTMSINFVKKRLNSGTLTTF